MKSRAALVNATFDFETTPDKGVSIVLSYPI